MEKAYKCMADEQFHLAKTKNKTKTIKKRRREKTKEEETKRVLYL